MTAALFLREDVDFRVSLLVRGDRLRSGQNLTAFDAFFFNTAEQDTDVVTSLAAIEQLAEHFDTGHNGGDGVFETDDFDGVVDLDNAALNTTGSNRATTGDREHVFNGHQEGLVVFTNGFRNIVVDRVHQLSDSLITFRLVFETGGSRPTNDRRSVTWELVLIKKLANFHFDEIKEFLVVDEVDLV